MNDTQCVRDFMLATTPQQVASMPGLAVRDEVRILRARLVMSEALELCEALGVFVYVDGGATEIRREEQLSFDVDAFRPVDIVETADACADLRYVVVGTEIALGIPGDAVFAEVHRSNMTKVLSDGSTMVDEGGKVLKPPSYSPPDVVGALNRHREEAMTC